MYWTWCWMKGFIYPSQILLQLDNNITYYIIAEEDGTGHWIAVNPLPIE